MGALSGGKLKRAQQSSTTDRLRLAGMQPVQLALRQPQLQHNYDSGPLAAAAAAAAAAAGS
jgi:hypothetical protein